MEKQLDYYLERSPKAATKFRDELFKEIRTAAVTPFSHRKSIYFNDENIRDVVFNGYTVLVKVNGKTLEVFGLIRYQEKPFD